MKIATREQMKEIDRLASRTFHIPSVVLMENAGEAVVRILRQELPHFKDLRYTIFCGTGNNGGDGAVIARKLFLQGISVKVYFLGDPAKAHGDAKINFEILQSLAIPYDQILSVEDWSKMRFLIQSSDVFIDAIFGIGFHGNAKEPFRSVCHTINEIKQIHPNKTILSVDIPSGVYANLGASASSIKADITVTFGLPKPGMLDFPGKACVGKLHVAPINLPPVLLQNRKLTYNYPTISEIRKIIPLRPRKSHKGKFGHLLVIGGQSGMIGAPLFCAQAAQRAGCGLVTLALPQDLLNTAQSVDPSVMTTAYPKQSEQAVKTISDFIHKHKIRHIVIGNGLGKSKTAACILSSILNLELDSLILDADALNLIAANEELKKQLKNFDSPTLLTPHVGEMSRLTNISIKEISQLKSDTAQKLVADLNVNVLLKDSVSVLSLNNNQTWFLDRGNSALAKGGSGDILAGLISGLCASGCSIKNATLLGHFLHGLAAEIYSQNGDVFSALPQDILSLIPNAWEKLLATST